MSMTFTFITFTVFTSLKINFYAYFSFSKGIKRQKQTSLLPGFTAINLYHSTFLRNVDPDLNENSGGSTDLDQKIARIGGFPYPYSPLSISHKHYHGMWSPSVA